MYIKTLTIIIFLLFVIACRENLPSKNSENYNQAIKSFYVGLAAMQAADDLRAKDELAKATQLADGEPANWANLGILQMRQKDFDSASSSLEKAKTLATDNAQVYSNIAVLETQRGNFDKVIENLQKAIELNPTDTKSLYALAREQERQGNDSEAQNLYEKVLQIKPENLATQLELIRIAAKRNDVNSLNSLIAKIEPRTNAWDIEIRQQFLTIQTAIKTGNIREVSQNIAYFRNVLQRLPDYRGSISAVKFNDTTIGEPFLRPIKLQTPDFSPAAPDTTLKFQTEIIDNIQSKWAKAIFIDGDSAPISVYASDNDIKLGKNNLKVSKAIDLQTIDIDYNFKNDFVIVGENGLQFFSDNFAEITANTKLSNEILNKKYIKIFTFDIEIDGDLDLILATENSTPTILQNNADGTFKEIKLFNEIRGLQQFISADFDEDGDSDVALIAANGKLFYYTNERGGQFQERNIAINDKVLDIAFADTNGDSKLDLNVLTLNSLLFVSDKNDDSAFEVLEFFPTDCQENCSLFIADLDNNGSNDFVVNNKIWLTDKSNHLELIPFSIMGKVFSIVDFNGDGRLDLTGIDSDNKPTNFINSGEKKYGWQIIRPRSAKAEGDQRVNSFGIGGEMEIRTGLLAQKSFIASPQVHFGLGEQNSTDLLRIIWGNGFIQAEFDMQKDQQILVKQRLTGSCPHLFAWNGNEFKLVKDAAPLGTSLGLKVTDKDVLPVTQTVEWYKISGEQLQPKDGFYELRITDELWESYYVDRYNLLVVDHPKNTQVFVNEQYPIPNELKYFTTTEPKPFVSAKDEKGNDVSKLIENLDEIHLDTFEDGRYQGVAKEHFVELELPNEISQTQQIHIIADGWLHPTDTSLNVAISQSSHEKPKSLSLDILDEKGNWRTVKDDFGVPAGKLKTLVIDLPKGTKSCRLRTNMEIFWDKLAWAEKVSESENTTKQLELSNAELRFRGFSQIEKKNDSSPEIPVYNQIATTIQRWRSIEGYYTRYGDIRELLLQTDDRYALVHSGDEMILKFPELPPVREGFVRDFVIIGDGWIKEGDYNNVFSKTLLPLPTHESNDYSRKPTRLEDEKVYQKHKKDWQNFHTRYVSADDFRNAMRK